jgi:hypothetical protein
LLQGCDGEERLANIVELPRQHGGYDYRMMAA